MGNQNESSERSRSASEATGSEGTERSEAGECSTGLNFDNVIQVQILEAKPNPMFTEWQRAMTRFLRYSRAVPCAECGRRSRHHWTQLVSFKAHNLSGPSFMLHSTGSVKIHAPLTPVCGSHPLSIAEYPQIPLSPRAKKGAQCLSGS